MSRPRFSGLLGIALSTLVGCATPTQNGLTMADMDVIAKDRNFALVRLKTGQDYSDLAQVFHGHAGERWQLDEVNASKREDAGQIVAVPLQPMNSSSVYSDGYRTLPILCYHQFTARAKASHQLELSAAAFDAQLKYLVDNGYMFLSFADVELILKKGQPIPEKAVVITIDDGYRSVYDVAWPILKKYNAKATLFIYTDFIGAPAALSWAHMKEMAATGTIEIESHAKSHSSLSRLPQDTSDKAYQSRVRKEVTGSNAIFKKNFGKQPTFLSYPYGNSSIVASETVENEGLALAATVTRGDNAVFTDPYLLHRSMIYDSHNMKDFLRMLRGFRSMNLK
jgi:peptidoglycan/xylan/chitin deacetylase (PgdA/CDA1 family)